MPVAAEYLKLFKYIEKKVQERMGGRAHSIQQRAQSSAAHIAADSPMSQHLVYQFSKQAITYQYKWSKYMGSYFMLEGGRRRNAAFTGTLKVTELQCTPTHSTSQGLWGWQCRVEGKGYAIFSSIEDRFVRQLYSCIEEWTWLLKIRRVRHISGTSVPNCPPKSCVWR